MVVKSEHQGLRFPLRRRAGLLYRSDFRRLYDNVDCRGDLDKICSKKKSKTGGILYTLVPRVWSPQLHLHVHGSST